LVRRSSILSVFVGWLAFVVAEGEEDFSGVTVLMLRGFEQSAAVKPLFLASSTKSGFPNFKPLQISLFGLLTRAVTFGLSFFVSDFDLPAREAEEGFSGVEGKCPPFRLFRRVGSVGQFSKL